MFFLDFTSIVKTQVNLLDLIGQAEMEKEIQNTVTETVESQDILSMNNEREIELGEKEMKRYIDIVLREVKKDSTSSLT